MADTELNTAAVKAWCDELRRSKARVALMREELPAILAESGEEAAAAICADLELLDLHATILETWIITANVTTGGAMPAGTTISIDAASRKTKTSEFAVQ
jgi:hypothetical protein